MAHFKYGSKEEALAVAKEAIWLAWVAAGGPSGNGFLRDNPSANKDQVWDCAYNMRDYAGRGSMPEGRVNADYVFGRCMKLRFEIKGDTLEAPDYEPRRDYESWCYKYKTFLDLFRAAEESVIKSIV